VRRIAITLVALLMVGAFVVLATGAANSNSQQSTYWVELDNAFGLNKGGDMKVAGVRAGKITDVKLDMRNNRALIGFKINLTGFGSLRSDVFCQSRPQSLIGEYYLDCDPGTAKQLLRKTSTNNPIPVSQTASTIAPDLVGDILREPYRQRFSIILGELGAGVAGNGQNLSDAVHRAVPALRDTDSVLAILANQNHILADLATQGDTVLHDLADNRTDVQKFIVSANGAARDTAARKAQFEAGFAKLPGFLEALRPAMAALGKVTDTQTPALRNLNASAGQLRRLFTNLVPFSRVSTPAFAALGKASVTGDRAVKAATPTVQQLNAFAQGTPELGQNLSIILQHLDDPKFGADHDLRAIPQHPLTHSDTYTGLEALLQYVYDQGLSVNYFDGNSHNLGLELFADPNCGPYADAAAARAHPQCRAYLGPTQPGVTTPDPTHAVTPASTVRTDVAQQPAIRSQAPTSATAPAAGGGSATPGPACVLSICVRTQTAQPRQSAPAAGAVPAPAVTGQSNQAASDAQSSKTTLLNYLLGP
jgi:ABC-type transporter Mla subunit MlaD